MPKIRNKITGEIIEIPDTGRVVASAPPMPKAPVGFTPGPNPTVAPGVVQGQAQIAGAEAAAREAAQRQTIAYQTQQAIIEAQRKAEIDAKKQAEAERLKNRTLDPQKLANIRAVQAQIDRLTDLFIKGPGATKGLSGIKDFFPSQKNAQFDTAAAGLGQVGLAAFRVPGIGDQSNLELKDFVDANRPSASNLDSRIKEKINNLQTRLNQTYSAYGIKRQSAPKKKSGVIDFNDLPE